MTKSTCNFPASAALCAALLLTAASCSSVTLRDRGTAKISTEPTWQESKPFFLWGLVNKHDVNAVKICHGTSPVQMQSQDTFTDSLLTIITLGIYAPRTAKVWCKS